MPIIRSQQFNETELPHSSVLYFFKLNKSVLAPQARILALLAPFYMGLPISTKIQDQDYAYIPSRRWLNFEFVDTNLLEGS
jgi:hypothetical protein